MSSVPNIKYTGMAGKIQASALTICLSQRATLTKISDTEIRIVANITKAIAKNVMSQAEAKTAAKIISA